MDTGAGAARQRVEAVYAAVDGLGPEALSWTSLPPRDLADRTIRLASLEHEADLAGRGPLLDEARTWLRDALGQRMSSRGRRPESGVWGVSDVGRAEDIAAMLLALDDAVAVAATEDLIDPADAAALANQGRSVLGLAPLPGWPTGQVAEPDAPVVEAAAPAWEPTAGDWAAADAEAAADDAGDAATGDGPRGSARRRRGRWATGGVAIAVAFAAVLLFLTGSVALALLAAGLLGTMGWSAWMGQDRR